MSTVTYTAKREIEKTTFSKLATDISAAAADDSFNSITTSLLGLNNDEWINVAGFANAANNGWFQANGASTANKITQDTSTALVTEAAGPSIALQGYKRGYGQSYTIEFTPRKLERSVKLERKKSQALGGARETLFQRRDVFWDVNSGRLLEEKLAQWREFLASVEAGESFIFDPYGTIAVPNNPLSVELDSDSYQEDRISVIRQYIVPFRVRVL